jgi:hypothetical protein
MISLGSVQTEIRDGETVIPDDEEDKLLDELADKVAERLGESEVEVRSTEDNPALTDVWLAGIPMGKLLDKALQNSRESGSSPSESTGDGEEPRAKDDTTTLERIADDDADNPAGIQIGPSIERAAAVMENWQNWSKKAPKGRNIRDGLRTLIETATGETLAWRQVYRACKKVEQLTKGKIVFIKNNKHGWMLLQPNERASSAASG